MDETARLSAARFEHGINHGVQLGHNYAPVTNNFFNEVPDKPAPAWTNGNLHYMVTRPVNTLFTGRASILTRLRDVLQRSLTQENPSTQCRVVITGIGGQGKSEICLRLANDLRQFFWGVFWIDVSDASQVEASFIAVAEQLHKTAKTMTEAKQVLSNLAYPWLLVLDNADDPNVDYQDYLPTGYNGCVLMTSRNQECSQYATAEYESLEALDSTDAQKLLLKAAQVAGVPDTTQVNDANEICTLLGSHPLALIQAGSYIAQQYCTLAEYPKVYHRFRQRLLRFHPKQATSRYRDVYTTFEASMDILRRNSSTSCDAQEILSVLSMLDWNNLPIAVFEAAWVGARNVMTQKPSESNRDGLGNWHTQRLVAPMEVEKSEWDSYRLMDALRVLNSLALISLTTVDGCSTLSMHPLTHSWARDIQNKSKADGSWVSAACLIALSSCDSRLWWRQRELLRPHLLSILNRPVEDMFCVQPSKMIELMLVACGSRLGEMQQHRQLLPVLLGIFKHLKLNPNFVSEDQLPLYELFADTLGGSGMLNQHLQICEQICSIDARKLAEDHSDRISSESRLAMAYRNNGQHKQAVEILRRLVEIEKKLAESDTDLVPSEFELAQAYYIDGQFQQAIVILERVVEIEKHSLEPDDRLALASQYELASSYLKNKQTKQAVAILETVMEIEKQRLRPDDPDFLTSQHELASGYLELGRIDQSIAMLTQVVKTRKQCQRDGHPQTLLSEFELSRALWAKFGDEQAVNLMTYVVKASERNLHPQHPHLLVYKSTLASMHKALSRVRQTQ